MKISEWAPLLFLIILDLCLLQEAKFFFAFFILTCIYLIMRLPQKSAHKCRKYGDVYGVFLMFIGLWAFLTTYVELPNPGLYPPPVVILDLLIADFPRFITNFLVSMRLFGLGLGIALLTGIILGITIGLNERLRNALSPYIKVLGGVSPIAYIPYIIGIMPTFRATSIFVIFFGSVWVILKWTIYGVASMDPNIYTGAKLMNIRRTHFIFRIILPGIMPGILEGASQAISVGFTVLIAAEMIGSREGLGFYVKYYADFLNYPKVIAGIIYLGASICFTTFFLDQLKRILLKWQKGGDIT